MPEPLRTASLLTPNAWGIDGYGALLSGGTLDDVALGLAALLAMTALLGGAAAVLFRRRQVGR